MRGYALALVQACHKRGAPAMGGMSALIPIKNDPVANEKALAGIRHDKTRDANDGFRRRLGGPPGPGAHRHGRIRQGARRQAQPVGKQVEGSSARADWLNFQPETRSPKTGLRNNINVGIHYLGSWLAGNGCVPIHNLMEDAATAEISRPKSGSGWCRPRASSTTAARSPSRWSAR